MVVQSFVIFGESGCAQLEILKFCPQAPYLSVPLLKEHLHSSDLLLLLLMRLLMMTIPYLTFLLKGFL